MFSRLSFRSVRSLSAALAVAALVIALTVPAQAAPPQESDTVGPLVTLVVNWLGSVLPSQGPAPRPPAGLPSREQEHEKSGVCLDPNGKPITCPESD